VIDNSGIPINREAGAGRAGRSPQGQRGGVYLVPTGRQVATDLVANHVIFCSYPLRVALWWTAGAVEQRTAAAAAGAVAGLVLCRQQLPRPSVIQQQQTRLDQLPVDSTWLYWRAGSPVRLLHAMGGDHPHGPCGRHSWRVCSGGAPPARVRDRLAAAAAHALRHAVQACGCSTPAALAAAAGAVGQDAAAEPHKQQEVFCKRFWPLHKQLAITSSSDPHGSLQWHTQQEHLHLLSALRSHQQQQQYSTTISSNMDWWCGQHISTATPLCHQLPVGQGLGSTSIVINSTAAYAAMHW